MHGAASPFMSGWGGLSPFDAYPHPPAAQNAQPGVPQHPGQPHMPPLPHGMNPRFQSPMDTYFHHMLQGVSGYPHKSLLEQKQHLPDPGPSGTTLPSFNSLSKKDIHMDRKTKQPKHEAPNNSSVKHSSNAWQPGSNKIPSFTQPEATRDEFNFKFSPFHSLESTSFNTSHSGTISGTTSAGLTWNNVFSSSVSTSTVPSSTSVPMSTSIPTMPVATSKSTPPANGIISYYSMPQDRKNYLVHNSVEAASKEAARILEEAHHFTPGSVGSLPPHDRKLTSPFLNISNDVNRQQQHHEMFYHNSVDDLKKHRPASRQSADSLPTKSPVDFRIENMLSTGRPSSTTKDVVHDFWSQFGLPPPNVDLEKMSQCSEKRSNDGLDLSDGLSHAAKRLKQDHVPNDLVNPSQESGLTHANDANSDKLQEERKKPEKLTRRKSFTDDPVIDALVEVKVQEIMAACRQKGTHGVSDKSKLSKSPKPNHGHASSKPLVESSERLPVYHQQQPQLDLSMPTVTMASTNNPPARMGASVFDFPECDEPKKHFSHQVKDMIHAKSSETTVNIVNQPPHSQNMNQQSQNISMNQWPKFDQHMIAKQQKLDSMSSGPYGHPISNMNEHNNGNQPAMNKRVSHEQPFQASQNKEKPLSNLPLHQVNSKKNNIPHDFPPVNSEMYQNKNSAVNKLGGEISATHGLSKNVTGPKSVYSHGQVPNGFTSGHLSGPHSGRLSPCCGNCSSLGVRFSENCQNHVMRNKVIGNIKLDPFQFSDEGLDHHQQHWNGVNKLNAKMHNLPPPYNGGMKHNKVQYNNGFGNGMKIQHLERNKNMFMKQGVKPEKIQKMKPLSNKFEKIQGNNNVSKKIVNKSYGLKSSLALIKKSQKIHQSKNAAMKRKWVNNPNYKKISKDDFAEKLKKNLGLPPLTLMDMVTKKCSKLPKAYMERKQKVKLNSGKNEKDICKTNDLITSLSTTSCNKMDGAAAIKECSSPVKRSRSVDEAIFMGENISIPRPKSTGSVYHSGIKTENSDSGLSVTVDNNAPFELNQDKVKCLSEQINGLREKVTGNITNLENNAVADVPKCACLGPEGVGLESVEGPYYNQLGVGRSVEAIRTIMEKRTGVTGKAIRIEKVRYTGKEGKSSQGCPIAKWIIRRSSEEEKYLTVVRHRTGHSCDNAWLIIGLVAWEGVPAAQADHLYDFLSETLPSHGNETERRCGTNDRKTCACQGADLMKRGASFSFGCSWSMYFNGCKFARSTHVRKFRLKTEDKEAILESKLQELAGQVGPLYNKCAPTGHANQCHFSDQAPDCRLGYEKGGPFSGVTACVDFCAHAHKDIHNMNNGSTVVVTLTKHRGLSKPDDEQLHVLPLYVLEPSDENGSYEGQYQKIQKGSLEVLHQYPLEARMRAFPLESCKKRRMNKKNGKNKNGVVNGRLSPWDSSSSTQSTPKKGRQDHYLTSSTDNTPIKQRDQPSVNMMDIKSDQPVSIDDLRSMSSQADAAALYDKFWDYYYAFGVFPPSSILAATSIASSKSSSNMAANQPNSVTQGEQTHLNNSVLPRQPHVNNNSHTVPSNSTLSQSQDSNHPSVQQHTDNGHQTPNQQPGSYTNNPPQYQSTLPTLPQHSSGGNKYADQGVLGSGIAQAPQPGPQAPQVGLTAQPTVVPQSQSEMQTEQSALDLSSSSSTAQPSVHSEPSINTNKPVPQLTQVKNDSSGNFSSFEKSGIPSSINSHELNTPQLSQNVGHSNQSGPNELKHFSKSDGQQLPNNTLHNQDRPRSSFSVSSLVQPSGNQHHIPSSVPSTCASLQGNNHSGYINQPGGLSDMYKPYESSVSNSQASIPGSKPTYSSPLDMLSQTVDNHSKDVGFTGKLKYAGDGVGPNRWMSQNGPHMPMSTMGSITRPDMPAPHGHLPAQTSAGSQNHSTNQGNSAFKQEFNPYHQQQDLRSQQNGPPNSQFWDQLGQSDGKPVDRFSLPSKIEPSLPDPDVVKCEMEYNEDAFRDPDVGGVAIALSHGAVLFEVAKRELHATTGLRNPNRYHPTRISLVFYQHKNLNNERHGMYAYANKLENMKMKRIEKMQLERGYVDMKEIENSFKGGKKTKMSEEEIEINELLQSSSGEYKYLWPCNVAMSNTGTTNTVSTKWIDPSPMVTGPYQKWK